MNKRGQLDLFQHYEAIKNFINEEKDTPLGLFLFMLVGLGITKYMILETIKQLQDYSGIVMPLTGIIVFMIWLNFRGIPVDRDKFNIAIAPFDILVLDVQAGATSEQKRNLRKELVDYVYSSLHFNKEQLEIDRYIDVVKLPKRFEANQKNAKDICKKLNVQLLIWGDAYFKNGYLYFKPRFEFLWEPTNIYYTKFKQGLNNLKTFKINITESLEKGRSDLAELLHYLSFLGLMFNGIHLAHYKRFKEAQDCFELAIKTMKKSAFHNRSLSDIYLATRFFYAQNMHKWGNYLLKEQHKKPEAMTLYDKAAKSFFLRAEEMDELKDTDKEGKLENSLLYGIYLLTKEGKFKEAEDKLEEIKKEFDKKTIYLYYLYKGLLQKNPKNAVKFFTLAVRNSKNTALVDEKIADYFFSRGWFKESIDYFNKRLKITEKQIYSPELLEEDSHRKLSFAYLKEYSLLRCVWEEVLAESHKSKNVKIEQEE
jgi:tetratricopeptide (TPR) repeat protein